MKKKPAHPKPASAKPAKLPKAAPAAAAKVPAPQPPKIAPSLKAAIQNIARFFALGFGGYGGHGINYEWLGVSAKLGKGK